jgi:hypothetical protein
MRTKTEMIRLTPELLWTEFPFLWHMAEPGSWPSIRDHGLLSAEALLDRYGVNGDERESILVKQRPESITIDREGMPNAVIRDQKPMSDSALRKCLTDDLTPADWYQILNRRTFFWLSRARLRRLLAAKAYRNRPQTILTLETRSLVEAHCDRIELSPINSGSTIFNPVPRGKSTFQSIANYDYANWRGKRARLDAVAELIVLDQVPDIRDHVIAVHDANGNEFTEIWRRPGSDVTIGP